MPPTPNGLVPDQSWLSIGTSPEGHVYITGSDHRTNAALYRLSARDRTLRYVGDARAASEAAGNWIAGETAEKFHNRPTWHAGRVYVATSDFTGGDAGYLKRRGFHWYAFDEVRGVFDDLGSGDGTGIGGAHASIVATTLDAERGWLYGIDSPRGLLFRLDLHARQTVALGRPASVPDGFWMPGRYLWLGQQGRVYFTLSSHDHVLFFDPSTGEFGERPEWQIQAREFPQNVIRTGCQTPDGRRVYLADRGGWLYRYDRDADSFEVLGRAPQNDPDYCDKGSMKLRAFNITADERTLYFINDDSPKCALWAWDLASGAVTRLCEIGDLDPRLDASKVVTHGGNDSWDTAGRFYFCSFGSRPNQSTPLYLTQVDPELLALHLASSRRLPRGEAELPHCP